MLRSKARPRVVSVWGADVIDFPDNWLKRAFIRRVLGAADHVTATSQLLKRVSEKFLPSVADKITVIPFGVRVLESFKPLPPPIPPRLCFIKAHNYKYGPDILLQAMAKVVKTIPNAQLSIAGVGELTEVLLKMTTDLNLDHNVTYTGFIDNAKIYDFVQEHHIMVMPSVMESESFGVAVLEASTCGRAVIASRVGGVPEVLIDGQTGILVAPAKPDELAEAIIKLATDPDLCAKMGQKGHSFVSKAYDWEDSVDAMAELYGRMIKEDD
jgi:glycosyltransferase involved in cell wall biosynthesis